MIKLRKERKEVEKEIYKGRREENITKRGRKS